MGEDLSGEDASGRRSCADALPENALAPLIAQVIATPDSPRGFAVEIRSRGAVLRRAAVDTRREADRLLVRLLAEAASDSVTAISGPA